MIVENMLQTIEGLFRRANYEIMSFYKVGSKKNKFCFDLLAKKDDKLYTVKLFSNIDNVNDEMIKEIKILSSLLNSKPILIGIKNRYEKLKDNTIYVREDLPFININTLENILTKNLFPHVLAKRGGGIVFLDGRLMKTLREQKNITRKELSEELGVTKRTICAYETETMRPSEKIGQKIMKLLEDGSLFRKINVLEWNLRFTIDQKELFSEEELNEFESHLNEVLDDIGLSSYWYKKGVVPFKLSLYSEFRKDKNEIYPVFSGISDEEHKINTHQLQCLKMFTQLLSKKALLIVDNTIRIPRVLSQNKIPVIRINVLEKMDDENDFIEFIQESEE
ncbi:MAG: helix-turn-helix domain-containing protein [Promethearchaeia archaeon]